MIRYILVVSAILFFNSCDDSTKNNNVNLKRGIIKKHLQKVKAETSNSDEKLESISKALAIVKTLSNNKDKLNFLQDISGEYYFLNDFEAYKNMTVKSLDLAEELKDSIKIAKFNFNIGLYFRNKGQLDSAYSRFNQAKKIYSDLNRNPSYDIKSYAYEQGKVLLDLAQISRRVKDYAESEAFTVKAIEKFEYSENTIFIPSCYSNLGTLSKYQERYKEAVNYHLNSIQYAKNTTKDTLYRVLGNNNIGTVYKSQKKYKEAIQSYKKALSNRRFLEGRPKRYSLLLDNLAYAKFLENKNEKELPDLFFKALEIRDSINDQEGLSTSNLHLAEYYKAVGNDSVAKIYGIKAKEISKKVKNNDELLRSYDLLAEVSDSEEGLKYAQAHIKLNDSLLKEERTFRDKFARIKFETKEKEQEIVKISRENNILIFSILGLTVLFSLIYVIFKQKQSNNELLFAQKQQESNQEIYRLLLSQQTKLEEGRKMEQLRMSEELHDGVLGRLFGVRLSLDGINERANDEFTESRKKYIEELKSIEKEIRLISHDLGTETLTPDVAYVDVVESLVSDLCTVHKMDFEFENDENIDWEVIGDHKKVNLFRIIQESLQNIFKHAQASSVKISFNFVDGKINLTILDDGIGFNSSKVKRGIGLKNITSRVSQMDGVVDFVSNQNTGTQVSVGVPI